MQWEPQSLCHQRRNMLPCSSATPKQQARCLCPSELGEWTPVKVGGLEERGFWMTKPGRALTLSGASLPGLLDYSAGGSTSITLGTPGSSSRRPSGSRTVTLSWCELCSGEWAGCWWKMRFEVLGQELLCLFCDGQWKLLSSQSAALFFIVVLLQLWCWQ